MMRKIILTAGSSLLLLLSGFSQATEMMLFPQYQKGGALSDGTRMATGRILCRDSHSSFHVWMNAKKIEGRSAHYIIKGQRNSKNEMRVRLSGDGWSADATEDRNGVVKIGKDESAIFDILIDGDQNAAPDKYIFFLRGVCL
ncbi:adhesin [Escherichia coli]|nr:adhesin [Escherichia coli]MIG26166.1 adhesin [Salmonella enterica subsp. enterica serovar Bredeney]EFA7477431.1 adhesin [Escherichia coli]EFA7497254.1 adhesin [Escherichia coli]EFA7540941.1 adhesin [Escherichia coli]